MAVSIPKVILLLLLSCFSRTCAATEAHCGAESCEAATTRTRRDPTVADQDHLLIQRATAVQSKVELPTSQEACLCVFDIDRTLTSKQGETCPGSYRVNGVWDDAYGGGFLTLSALAVSGIDSTFCGACYLGVVSAGHAGGHGSAERKVLLDKVLTTGPQRELLRRSPRAAHWSRAGHVDSPFVLGQPDTTKQHAVDEIVTWYSSQGVQIPSARVHFFGDRTENIGPFREAGYNAREISCASRDWSHKQGMVGLCGATPEEIVSDAGIVTCDSADPAPGPGELDSRPGRHGSGGELEACQGDCDADADCVGELKCFKRSGYEPVPGCSGRGVHGFDYCYSAEEVVEPSPNKDPTNGTPVNTSGCLCVFDIDRTLTSKQGETCPGSERVDGVWDDAYGGGVLTLSALAVSGIDQSFCGACYLGVVSAGHAGGRGSAERDVLATRVLSTGPQRELLSRTSQAAQWSHSGRVNSPFVLGQPDTTKQHAVAEIVSWYATQGIQIPGEQVHFFGDRTENIAPFREAGYNAREISCSSRDWSHRQGMVGLCGATLEEIVDDRGIFTCSNDGPAPGPGELDSRPGRHGGSGELQACQGDCDADADCAGELKCFKRSSYEPVPGCSGRGKHGYDYCYAAQDMSLPSLDSTPGNRMHATPLLACQGDCDSDEDCAGELQCFHRSGYEPVPGCSGFGVQDFDYCYTPTESSEDRGTTGLDDSPGPDGSGGPLERCQGDCDNDEDCASGLLCFHREHLESVPGCTGSGSAGFDYCIDPSSAR